MDFKDYVFYDADIHFMDENCLKDYCFQQIVNNRVPPREIRCPDLSCTKLIGFDQVNGVCKKEVSEFNDYNYN
jgi:hypothetical protein